jgi:hypothetical protein
VTFARSVIGPDDLRLGLGGRALGGDPGLGHLGSRQIGGQPTLDDHRIDRQRAGQPVGPLDRAVLGAQLEGDR